MYKQNFRPRRGDRNFSPGGRPSSGWRGGRNFGSRVRRQKTFDPSFIIKNLKEADSPREEEKFTPKNSFSDFNVSEKLKDNIARRGFTTPTPIQDQAIEEILAGRDVVGIANTGTGKTAAFLIPLIDKVVRDKAQKVLIITPTRELAVQIEKELYSITRDLGIFSTICIGGMPIRKQIYHLNRRPHFVIGTPGRLLDLYEQRCINFADYQTVVLDEVDRMLDMGFLPDMERIIAKLPGPRQSLFFSATITDKVRVVMNKFTANPVTISVKTSDTLAKVKQDVVRVNGKGKVGMLIEMLYSEEFEKVLVFGRTKRGVETLSRELVKNGFQAASIHGNKSQNQRQFALDQFKYGKVRVLLATDVASRGLDIDDISHVINYDLPETYEDYIHRIGRTGRANKAGVALTFVG